MLLLSMRHYTLFDQIISKLENFNNPPSSHSHLSDNAGLSNNTGLSESLMRINHCGEVCAQALYLGQAFTARNPELEQKLWEASEEEEMHLEWCRERIERLGGSTSLLNPLFAIGSFALGVTAGLLGDKVSLGFLAETEHQVVQHIDKHLCLLPKEDHESREILMKMREDELRHATNALQQGGIQFPWIIRKLMGFASKIMTCSTRYI